MKNKNIYIKTVYIPIVIGLIIIISISIYTVYKLQNKNIEIKASKHLEIVEKTLDEKISSRINIYSGLIDIIEKDENIVNAFKEKDRDRLYNYSLDFYKEFNKRFETTHFYFHLPNRVVFLRTHNRNVHSDLMNRYTLKTAQKENGESSGLEFGIHHNLTLRVVKPFMVNGELLGYVELGEEIGYMIPKMSKNLDTQIIISIKKELLTDKKFDEWIELFDKERKLINMKNYVIISSSTLNTSSALKNYIDNSSLSNRENTININNKFYSIKSTHLKDVSGKDVGLITALVNIDKEKTFLINIIIQATLLSILVSIIILIVFYIHLRKVQGIIDHNMDKIITLSITDGLTNLYNRRYFDETGPKFIKQAIRSEQYLSLVIIDIDNFKLYNDTYGHHMGDLAIKAVANSLKEVYKRDTDYTFRVGGEEFVVITIDNNLHDGAKNIQKLKDNIQRLNIAHIKNENFKHLTISAGGISIKLDKNVKLETLYQTSDRELYKAKNSGRNSVSMTYEL